MENLLRRHRWLSRASGWLAGALLVALAPWASAQTTGAEPRVQFRTSLGDFVVQLSTSTAPKTVQNFLQYVDDHHYDGTLFHRVIDGFVVQAGGYDTESQLKPTRAPVEHEGQSAIAKGGMRNTVGTIAMARTSDPHSATSQFYINVADNVRLNPAPIPDGDPIAKFEWQGQTLLDVPRAALLENTRLMGYTVFGHVVSGMDTIDRIRQVPTGAVDPFPQDSPLTPVVIFSATRVTSTP